MTDRELSQRFARLVHRFLLLTEAPPETEHLAKQELAEIKSTAYFLLDENTRKMQGSDPNDDPFGY